MKSAVKFLFWELIIFLILGSITLIEVINFRLFESFFTYIKTPSSWFIGLSISYAFSKLFQKKIFSLFSKNEAEERENRVSFEGFIISLIITSLIAPYLRDGANYFFNNIFPYFHIIIMQSFIVLYLLFNFEKGYEISGKYFLTNQLMVLLYTAIVLYFVV